MLTGCYPKLMGVLNVTPDSFYDGGQYHQIESALARARQMVAEGADIIDLGGESSRPGATPITPEIECKRVIPVIKALKESMSVPLSIDTYHPQTLEAAIEAGVDFVNDITALTDPEMMRLTAQAGLPVCLMHMQGTPQQMQASPHYTDVVEEIVDFFEARLVACAQAGITREKIFLDPGFGFGKNLDHNLQLLAHLHRFTSLGCPLLIGLSRKSMWEHLLGIEPEERLIASTTGAVIAALQAPCLIRTHDVAAMKQAIQVIKAVKAKTAAPSSRINTESLILCQ